MINCVQSILKIIRDAIIISLIQHFEADFLWKVSLKILNPGLILKNFTHANARDSNITALDLISVNHFLGGNIGVFGGRSKISGKGDHTYKGVGGSLCCFNLIFFLNIQLK